MLGVTLLLLGCADVPDPGAEEQSTFVAAELPDPAWDKDGVAEEIQQALEIGLPNPRTILEEFQAMWEGADPACPSKMGEYSMTQYNSWCDTSDGYIFSGVSTYEPGDGEDFWLLGDCWIVNSEGETFTCAGELERSTGEDGWTIDLMGTWRYPSSQTPWLARSTGMALNVQSSASGVRLEGAWGVDEADLFFEDMVYRDGCASGVVWLRDPLGSWYTLTLSDGCDGCGDVKYGEDALGEACVDLTTSIEDLISREE